MHEAVRRRREEAERAAQQHREEAERRHEQAMAALKALRTAPRERGAASRTPSLRRFAEERNGCRKPLDVGGSRATGLA